MDVLLDTNAIRAAGLDGPAFRSLRDYLSRTNSSLLVPDVVLQELLAQKQAAVHQVQRDLDNAFKALKRLDPGSGSQPPRLNAPSITGVERSRILSTAKQVVILENDGTEDLPEMVRRLAHRVAPASANGEEARDVLIWLAARRRLSDAPLAFISADKGFVGGSAGLRAELIAELGPQANDLLAFRTLDDFLAKHHARVSSITEAWVVRELAQPVVHEAVVGALDEYQWLFEDEIAKLGEPSGYVNLVQIVQDEIRNFFVSDLPGDELYVGATVWAELELEVEFYPESREKLRFGGAEIRCIYPCVKYHVQLEVSDMQAVHAKVTAVESA